MTKSELMQNLVEQNQQFAPKDIEIAVNAILERMSMVLAKGERIEIRGFGSFSLHYRPARIGRNPKSGTSLAVPAKYVPHFKPGKLLRERVNGSAQEGEESNNRD